MNRLTRFLLVLLIAVPVGGFAYAQAATIGGIVSSKITTLVGTGYPLNVSVSDSFAGTGGLNGRILASGQTWTSHSGTWSTITGSLVKTTSSSSLQMVTLPWINVPTRVNVTLSGNGSYLGGLAMHVSSDGRTGTVLSVKNNGQVKLTRYTSGSASSWLTISSTSTGTFSLSYEDGVYTVYRNSSSLGSYTAVKATVEANTRIGLFASGSSTSLRWAAFNASNI